MSNKSRLLLCTTLLLVSAIGSQAQTQTGVNPVINAPNVERRIVYTGKLLGYFRVPSKQSRSINTCPSSDAIKGDASPAAREFLNRRDADPSAILVGTGDNFAPQLEARTFSPEQKKNQTDNYLPVNKELFYWNGKNWVDYNTEDDNLRKILKAGRGTIPNDNVGCFLAAAKFAAIVPGKHDFYFGADRVRLLARFLAGIKSTKEYEPVQMLGANLVMSTSEIKSTPLLPREKERPWWGDAKWPENHPVLNLSDGSSVYPWYSYFKIKLVNLNLDNKQTAVLKEWLGQQGGIADATPLRQFLVDQKQKEFTDLETELGKAIEKFKSISLYQCPSTGAPNEIGKPNPSETKSGCRQRVGNQIGLVGNSFAYFIPAEAEQTTEQKHFSTFTPDNNYGLCSLAEGKWSCLRFSVYRPFFYHPRSLRQTEPDYVDPEPYVLTKDGVAIFGVVETELSEHVGVLNFGWQHDRPDLKTVVSAQDPAEALRQQLDYFERRCREMKCKATGLKVLLAQMSPQRARLLNARLPEFQVIVTGADAEQGTNLTSLSSTWTPNRGAGAFVAVPLPGFDRAAKNPAVHFSKVDALQAGNSWVLSSNNTDPATLKGKDADLKNFWERVSDALSTCLPARLHPLLKDESKASGVQKLKWLTLCALREKMGADVALVQSRDFFDSVPNDVAVTRENTQEVLDRLIWKGDLVTLLFVRGSALKQALKDSKRFATEDASVLSLADEKLRQLEILGIDTDEETGESLIKELPIDDNKTYTVATTDYIGAGDTGYPILASAALNARTYPAAFPKKLISLSGTVCRKIFTDQSEADQLCLAEIERLPYLDETDVPLIAAQRRPGLFQKMLDNFKFSTKDKIATELPAGFQEMAQRRPFRILSVRKISLGYTKLSNSLTDAELDKNFPGVSFTSVQSHKNSSLTIGVNSRLSHFNQDREYFIEGGIDFKKDIKGIANTESLVTQTTNRIFLDPGIVFRFPGKSLPHLGVVVSGHFEMPLERPVSFFDLATKKTIDEINNIQVNERIEIPQTRSKQAFLRGGLRYQNKDNFIEGGFQGGREYDAFIGYRFNTPGIPEPVDCLVSAVQTLKDCILEKSHPDKGLITTESAKSSLHNTRNRFGGYWKLGLSVPFGEKVKYELEDEGNYFVNFSGDTSVDTRWMDISKHRLRFFLWPSISIGPTYQLLFYRNKITDHWLTQRTFTFETVFTFDLFNRRERKIQIANKP